MEDTADVRVPVLVVGGSLVGLSTSLFLSRHGIRHLVVEKHAGTSDHPRGRGINARTMELFRVAGAEGAIRQAASALENNMGILQTQSLLGGDHKWLVKAIDPAGALSKFSPSAWCVCSQNNIEPILAAQSRAQGADVRFSTELMSFDQDETGVNALVKDRETGEHITVRADFLIAADGPRSPVREQLRIPQTGSGELFHNVSVTFRSRQLVEVLGDLRFIVCYLMKPGADGALLPVDNDTQWVFHLPWHPDQGETLEDFTEERCRSRSGPRSAYRTWTWRSAARLPGTRRNGSPSSTPPVGCSWPATRPTRCPPPAPSAPTPASRTRTTWPGRSRPS